MSEGWIDLGNVVGPQGPQGIQGPQGFQGPQGKGIKMSYIPTNFFNGLLPASFDSTVAYTVSTGTIAIVRCITIEWYPETGQTGLDNPAQVQSVIAGNTAWIWWGDPITGPSSVTWNGHHVIPAGGTINVAGNPNSSTTSLMVSGSLYTPDE